MLGKIIAQVLLKKATKSVTSYIGAAIAAGGATAALDPTLIAQLTSAVPAPYQSWIVTGVGLAVIAFRHRKDFIEAYARLKAELAAAEAQAAQDVAQGK